MIASWWRRQPDWNAVARAPLAVPPRSPEGRVWNAAAWVLGLAYVASGLLWASADRIAPMWDQSRHAWNALRLAEFLTTLVEGPSKLGDFLVWHDSQYVWVPYLPAAIGHLVGGSGFDVDAGTMTLCWTPMLLASMWSLGVQLTGQRAGGMAAMAWVAASPMVVDLSKDMLLDLPMLALTSLAMALLVRSRFLMERRASVMFGAVCGLLMLTKAVMPASFLAAPVLMAAWNAWRIRQAAVFTRNLVMAFSTGAVLALPFYATNVEMLQRRFLEQGSNAAAEGDPTSFGDGLATYVGALMQDQARGVLLVPLVLGALLWLRLNVPWAVFMGLCSATVLVVWPLFPNKDPRYTLPLLTWLGMFVTGGVLVEGRRAWAGIMAVLCAGMLLGVQWGFPSLLAQKGFLRGAPDAREPSMEPLVREIGQEIARSSPRRALVVHTFTHDEPHHNTWNLVRDAWALGRRAHVVMDPKFAHSAEYLVQSDCAPTTPPMPVGFAFLTSGRTPQGCMTRALVNREMQRREALMREGPELNAMMRRSLMEHRIVGATFPSTVKRGETMELGVLVKIERNRRPVFMARQFSLGPSSVRWEVPDDAWNVGDTYPLIADLVAMEAGVFELRYSAEGATFSVDGKDSDALVLGTVTVE